MVQLCSADAVRAMRPDVSALGDARAGVVGLDVGTVGLASSAGPRYECRALTPRGEDGHRQPQRGYAQWFRSRGLVPTLYTCHQGSQVQRASEIEVRDEDGALWIGGAVRTVVTGSVDL